MAKEFNFKHNYHKLRLDQFADIRGITRLNQYKVGDIVGLKKLGKPWGTGKIVKVEHGNLAGLSQEWCRHLVSHGAFSAETPRHVMAYLNTIRHFKARLTSVNDEIAIFHIRKVRV
jgi:hypothetical protein